MPFIPVQGERLFYARHRGGLRATPLLLIHGAGGSHLQWPAALRRLPDADTYVPDLPGHGRSKGAGRQSIAAYRDAILGFMDGIGMERSALAGHSMGGAIALEMALRYPNRLMGLVLIGSGARLRVAPALLEGLQTDFRGAVEQLCAWLFAESAPEQLRRTARQQLLAASPQVVYGDFLACDRFDVMGELGRVETPTLVVCGTADRMTPLKYSQHLAGAIPGARLETIPGGGHMVMLEQPETVAQAVRAFLGRLAGV
ncbi:MAG: alpha/beta fold hydrolase [Anaerolineae bacterium]